MMPREGEGRGGPPASTGPRMPAIASKPAETEDKQNRIPPQPSGGTHPADTLTSDPRPGRQAMPAVQATQFAQLGYSSPAMDTRGNEKQHASQQGGSWG